MDAHCLNQPSEWGSCTEPRATDCTLCSKGGSTTGPNRNRGVHIPLRLLSQGWPYGYELAIIQAPFSVIDYIIVHELIHGRDSRHRQTFWDAMRVILPDFAARNQWLRDHEAELGRSVMVCDVA